MSQLISIQDFPPNIPESSFTSSLYTIVFLEQGSTFMVDGTDYDAEANTVLFLSPYQSLVWSKPPDSYRQLSFHSDFYCIEYHKYEVACNGLLFNNAYLKPYVSVSPSLLHYLYELTDRIAEEQHRDKVELPFTSSIIKTYLQLLLALCSRQKDALDGQLNSVIDRQALLFEQLLEKHHLEERRVLFYAHEVGVSPEVLSRKSKQAFGKTPSQLIQDRVIIAAKRLLHLTDKSIKEIALMLNFQDEFYFSRYFKKATGLSPKHFRDEVGITIITPPQPPH
ncbi:helix-turn-helix domain-containing protein [Porphyromonas canoris]|uniref:helix-turn-helix domain-containing protein n=1 Tax=Porphyromonas canoris TaxID=36875 RepID=UPI00068F9811|nr:AraC family transcriptional regulator [Porphyromonas canoris]